MRSALQLVENTPFYRKELELAASANGSEHSLHYSLPITEGCPPELAQYFIERFSKKGEIVLDPFCGTGAIPLEAALRGRIPYASDPNPFFARMAEAKTSPSDLTEVTLALQGLQLRRPMDLKVYAEYFSHFYDVATFRELVQLRDWVHETGTPVARFIELISQSLLHGPSAGAFSVYTFPQISLRPEMQKELNRKRNQAPDYRAVVPRILRRTASLLRDGVPSAARQGAQKGRFVSADARNLNFISRPGVSLVVTAPPIPVTSNPAEDLWLRLWFSGIQAKEVSARHQSWQTLGCWLEFMSESLFELARVVSRGGRAVLVLKGLKIGSQLIDLDEELMAYVNANLSQYWEAECILVSKEPEARLKGAQAERDQRKVSQRNRSLVLRRR
jgi:hypothetical protein